MGVRFERYDKGTLKAFQVTGGAAASDLETLTGEKSCLRGYIRSTANGFFIGDASTQSFPVAVDTTYELFSSNLDTIYVKRNGGADATLEILLWTPTSSVM